MSIAQVAMGGDPQHALLAFREAEAYPGPSLILAYCHCIAHGIDMQFGMRQQDLAVASGYWPLAANRGSRWMDSGAPHSEGYPGSAEVVVRTWP